MLKAPLYLFNRFLYRIFVFFRLRSLQEKNYNDLKFSMSAVERFAVRLIGYVFYGLLIVLVVVWLFSEIIWMRIIAVILLVFLLDRSWWLKRESAASLLIVEYALDRAEIFGGDFYLWAAERAVDHSTVKNWLAKKGIRHKDLEKRIKGRLKSALDQKTKKQELVRLAEDLVGDGVSLPPDRLFERLIEKSEDVRMLLGISS